MSDTVLTKIHSFLAGVNLMCFLHSFTDGSPIEWRIFCAFCLAINLGNASEDKREKQQDNLKYED